LNWENVIWFTGTQGMIDTKIRMENPYTIIIKAVGVGHFSV
jgi:hypothetical protein